MVHVPRLTSHSHHNKLHLACDFQAPRSLRLCASRLGATFRLEGGRVTHFTTSASRHLDRLHAAATRSTSAQGAQATATATPSSADAPQSSTIASDTEDWLFKAAGSPLSEHDLQLRHQFAGLLRAAAPLLQRYDVRTDAFRSPNLRKVRHPLQLSLTAQLLDVEAARLAPRQEAPQRAATRTVIEPIDPAAVPQPVEDGRWLFKKRTHQAYLSYMRELHTNLTSAGTVQEELDKQLMYQVRITEDWVQLSHILDVFATSATTTTTTTSSSSSSSSDHAAGDKQRPSQSGTPPGSAAGTGLGAPTCAAMFKHLAKLITPKARASFSPYEKYSFGQFLGQLTDYVKTVVPGCGSRQVANILYGMACLEARDKDLVAALVRQAEPLLQQPWPPADYASALWALGVLQHRPDDGWLEALCATATPTLQDFHSSQLWGTLHGLAQLSYLPTEKFMQPCLHRAAEVLKDFTAEGLSSMIWALGALRYVPEKMWMRAYAGMASAKIRSFFAPQLTQLFEGISALGYKPRPQICLAFLGQARRYIQTLQPAQASTLIHSIASYNNWVPYRTWLYDYVTLTQPKLGNMTAAECARVVWSFARFKYMPDEEYLEQLLGRLQEKMYQADGEALSMALWALATFKRPPQPAWLQAWYQQAQGSCDTFSAPSIAHTAWAAAKLQLQPPPELMQALTVRGSELLPTFSCMELSTLLSSLADLQYRPSDAWLDLYMQQAMTQLPAFTNEDYGLLLYGFAWMGTELPEPFLLQYTHEAGRKLYSMGPEGLSLLVWGLGQYGYRPDSDKWWQRFYAEVDRNWEAFDARGLAMMLVGLGELLDDPPPGDWCDRLNKAIRLAFKKPSSSERIEPLLAQAAGQPDGEALSPAVWVRNFLIELQIKWGFPFSLRR